MVGHRQQAVGIGREVNSRDLAAMGEHDLNQPRPLVGEPVVLVPPSSGGQQHVETGNPCPPRQPRRALEPFAVLHVWEALTMANAS